MEENAKISGFHTIATRKPINFNEINTSELERILNSFILSPEFITIKKFFENLDYHLTDTAPFHINMQNYKNDLVEQLFQIYIQAGYSGEYKDMLNSIVKDIDVASNEIARIGVSTTQAMTAQQFKNFFKKHVESIGSHYHLFQPFRIKANWNLMPLIHFTSDYKEDYNPYIEDGYTVTEWNPTSGTIIIDFKYITDLPKEILVFHFEDPVIRDNILTTESGVITFRTVPYEQVMYIADKVHNKSANTTAIPMTFDTRYGSDRLIISYDLNQTFIRTLTNNVISEFNLFHHNITSLEFKQELGGEGQSSINEFAYYNVAADETEAVFLLN